MALHNSGFKPRQKAPKSPDTQTTTLFKAQYGPTAQEALAQFWTYWNGLQEFVDVEFDGSWTRFWTWWWLNGGILPP